MKRKDLHLARGSWHFALLAILGFTFVSISTTTISAQANVLVSTGDIADTEWKSLTDYTAVIATERTTAAQTLAGANLQDFEVALYRGYDRMLGYIQADIAGSVPVAEIAVNNFKKVMLEYPSDPILKNMREGEFRALYASLIEKLVQPVNHDIGH